MANLTKSENDMKYDLFDRVAIPVIAVCSSCAAIGIAYIVYKIFY